MRRRLRIAPSRLAITLAGLLACAPIAPAVGADDASEGELKYNNHCRTCHSTKQGDNRMGPSLHAIFGAKAGTVPGYANYSQGLRSSSIVWDEKSLDRFIANPDDVIPTNNMKPYKGITDPEIRAQIVDYLKSNGSARPTAQ
jgi:cytochrome c